VNAVKCFSKIYEIDQYRDLFRHHLFMICLSVNICSHHDLPGMKPACSCPGFPSTAFLIRFSNITLIIFPGPGVNSRVMPLLQFVHSLRSRFFGIGMMIPSFQSSGSFSFVHTLLHTVISTLISSAPPCLIISADVPSLPADVPFFRPSTVLLTSSNSKVS